MDNEEPTREDLVPAPGRAEKALDVASVLTSAVPWMGGPVGAVLGGMAIGRKMQRIEEAFRILAEELRDVEGRAAQEYVRTEDFEELLERTLRQIADERSEEKRRIYAEFLAGEIKSPGGDYDEQIRFLRTLEEMQADHLRIIEALARPPEGGDGIMGSPSQTLRKRLPTMEEARIADLVSQLNDMRVTSLNSLNTTMTFDGAQNLKASITPYGQQFLRFLETDE